MVPFPSLPLAVDQTMHAVGRGQFSLAYRRLLGKLRNERDPKFAQTYFLAPAFIDLCCVTSGPSSEGQTKLRTRCDGA